MDIIFKIASYHRLSPDQEAERRFSMQNATIGRSSNNDWVLPDPERIVSGQHAVLSYESGSYFITDTSTNGLYLNKSNTPVGRGNKVKISSGDHLRMGEYEFDVVTEESEHQSNHKGEIPQNFDSDIQNDSNNTPAPNFNFSSEYNRNETPPPPSIKMMDFGEDDNFFAPPKIEPEVTSEPVKANQPNVIIPNDWNTPPQKEDDGFSWEEPSNDNIPEDLFGSEIGGSSINDSNIDNFDPISTPKPMLKAVVDNTTSNNQNQKNQNQKEQVPQSSSDNQPNHNQNFSESPSSSSQDSPSQNDSSKESSPQEIATPKQAAIQQNTPKPTPKKSFSTSDAALVDALIEGLGVRKEALENIVDENFMRNTGMMLRETVQGLIEILRSRSSLKSEFRASQTMIRPAENNPLKFSPTFEDAMYNLFIKTGKSYLQPVESVQEAIVDIKKHQLAVMAGFQGALMALLDKFSPENIIEGADKSTFSKKAKYWEHYEEIFNGVQQEAEDNIQKLLGEEFTKAYEEQDKKG